MTADWYVPLGAGSAAVRVFMFPHAGGGPAGMAELAEACPGTVDPWSVNLPGRQARLAEPPRTDLAGLVRDMTRGMTPYIDRPFALFGYCGGALLAYLVAAELTGMGHVPRRVIVGSAAAPDVGAHPRRLHRLPSAAFWDELIDQGGVPPEVAEHRDLRPVLEPALRADLALLAGYRHVPRPALPCGITVLHGRVDRHIRRGGLLGWRRQSTRRLVLREMPASHWIVEEAPRDVAAAIAAEVSD